MASLSIVAGFACRPDSAAFLFKTFPFVIGHIVPLPLGRGLRFAWLCTEASRVGRPYAGWRDDRRGDVQLITALHRNETRRTCMHAECAVFYSSCVSCFGRKCMENSPSGLWRTLGKRVGVTASRVRISYSPPSGFPVFRKPFFHTKAPPHTTATTWSV